MNRRRAVAVAVVVLVVAVALAGATAGAFTPRLDGLPQRSSTNGDSGTVFVRVVVDNRGIFPVDLRSVAAVWPGYELLEAQPVVDDEAHPWPLHLAGGSRGTIELVVRVHDCAVATSNAGGDAELTLFAQAPLGPARATGIITRRAALVGLLTDNLCHTG